MIRVGNEQAHLQRQRRTVSLGVTASEAEIVYHLGIGTVYFCPVRQTLYFCDSKDLSISGLVMKVMKTRSLSANIERVFLDHLQYLSIANKVKLDSAIIKPVLVALRISGVQINIGKEQ